MELLRSITGANRFTIASVSFAILVTVLCYQVAMYMDKRSRYEDKDSGRRPKIRRIMLKIAKGTAEVSTFFMLVRLYHNTHRLNTLLLEDGRHYMHLYGVHINKLMDTYCQLAMFMLICYVHSKCFQHCRVRLSIKWDIAILTVYIYFYFIII